MLASAIRQYYLTLKVNTKRHLWNDVFPSIVFFFATMFTTSVTAQVGSHWRMFKVSDGLADAICTTVTVSPRTNVWVTHLQNGLATTFDGYQFNRIPAAGLGPTRIYETPGGQIWAVAPDGIQEFRDDKWVQYPIPAIAAITSTNPVLQLRQISLLPFKQGNVLISLPDRLLAFSNEGVPTTSLLKSSSATSLGRFFDFCTAHDGGVWVGGGKGLAHVAGPLRNISADIVLKEFVAPKELDIANIQHPFEDGEGTITAIAESGPERNRVIVCFDGANWTVHRVREKVRLAWRDSDKILWAMTSNALLRRDEGSDKFVEDEEISVSQFFDAAPDPTGAFWVATADGLYRRTRLPWQTPGALKGITGRVHAMTDDNDGNVWIASNGGLHSFNGQTVETYPYPETLEHFFQPSDNLWLIGNKLVMNADGRLLQFDVTSKTFSFRSHPSGGTIKGIGALRNGALCVQVATNAGNAGQLNSFDGQSFAFVIDLSTNLSLGNELTSFLVAQNGSYWVGSATGIAVSQGGTWKTFSKTEGVAPDAAFNIVETADGKMWCGGKEQLWEFNNKLWTTVRGGFDGINAIAKTAAGTYWVASNNGIYGFRKGDWISNSSEEGLPRSSVISIFEDRKRRLWAGTTHGVCLYDRTADIDPPTTTVNQLDNKKNNWPETSAYLTFHSRDRWKATQSYRLLYSFRLDGQEWTPWRSSDAVSFSDLASGKHYFQVRSIDRSYNIDPAPAVLEFTISLPWYEETRLVVIALAGCAVALFFAVLAYNRHRKLVRSYAEIEKTVVLRTEQLEKANQELLHSQKMTALGTLSAGVAHDFNNILSIIKGSAQIIESNLEDREKVQTRVNRIKTVVEQGAGIVKAMLGFSGGSDQKISLCNINDVVDETIKLLGDRFLREIHIRFQPGADVPSTMAAKEFIRQIILNFIFNAADATNRPGKVVLRTGTIRQLSGYIALQPAMASEYVFVSVEDYGCGISSETMPRIFEPFFTTKAFSARRGTGLGLSMVYELAKSMGCGLTVQSEVGKGSTFTLVIPLLSQSENNIQK